MKETNNDHVQLVEAIQDIKFAMFTTVAEDGAMHSRPMATQNLSMNEFDGVLWFFSKKNSYKNHEIESDQNVNLSYSQVDKQKYVSVSGKAVITTDKEKMKELWNPFLKAWFPEGLEDPEISLIGVRVESAEIWDSAPGKVVQLLGFVKAAVTGRPFDQDLSSKHIEIQH